MIKFRIRDAETKKIVGYEELFPVNLNNNDYRWACSNDNSNWCPGNYYENKPLIREKYTGFNTDLGVEVYEGDVVKIGGLVEVVEYKDNILYCYSPEIYGELSHKDVDIDSEICSDHMVLGLDYFHQYKVIGDIYQTPKLIKNHDSK